MFSTAAGLEFPLRGINKVVIYLMSSFIIIRTTYAAKFPDVGLTILSYGAKHTKGIGSLYFVHSSALPTFYI